MPPMSTMPSPLLSDDAAVNGAAVNDAATDDAAILDDGAVDNTTRSILKSQIKMTWD